MEMKMCQLLTLAGICRQEKETSRLMALLFAFKIILS